MDMLNRNTKSKNLFIHTMIVVGIFFILGCIFNVHNNQIVYSVKDNDHYKTSTKINSNMLSSDHISNTTANSISNEKTSNLYLTLRDLWTAHTEWTRNYIISSIANLPDVKYVAQRLLLNQEEIGNAIKPFYGDEAGNKLTSLLKAHILGAVDLLNAAKAKNTSQVAIDEKKWFVNAEQIAKFLSSANPNWSKESLIKMLDDHLSLTKSEAVARLAGNYTADIDAYNKIRQEVNSMSDILANGIIKQFPDKFIS